MCRPPRLPIRALCGALAALLALHLLAIVAMASLGQLHELAHADAHEAGHQCAVTLYQYGLLDVGAAAPTTPLRPETAAQTPVAALRAIHLPAPCLSNGVLEHAPPAAHLLLAKGH